MILQENDSVILLASLARIATITDVDRVNKWWRAIQLIVDVTTAGTGSITAKIQGKDPNGVYYDVLAGAAITTISTNLYTICPGAVAAANSVANNFLPRIWRLVLTHNNANTITYSVGANLLR